MATGHIYLTNNSPGAPDLTNAAGSLISVLDWALDTAGGTHWEKVFSGTNKAAYRATTGQRYYLQVDDSIGQVARVRGFASMSDVDTGTDPFPSPTSSSGLGYGALPKSSDANGRDYIIVGDSRFFMLRNEYSHSTFPWIPHHFAFGELSPLDPLDAYCTMLIATMGQNSTSAGWSTWNSTGSPFNSNSGFANIGVNFGNVTADDVPFRFAASPDGLTSSISAYGMHFVRNANSAATYSASPVLAMSPIRFTTGDGDAWGDNPNGPLRATLPYYYVLDCPINGGLSEGDILSVSGSTYEVIYQSYSTSQSSSNSFAWAIRTSNDEPGRA